MRMNIITTKTSHHTHSFYTDAVRSVFRWLSACGPLHTPTQLTHGNTVVSEWMAQTPRCLLDGYMETEVSGQSKRPVRNPSMHHKLAISTLFLWLLYSKGTALLRHFQNPKTGHGLGCAVCGIYRFDFPFYAPPEADCALCSSI